VRDNPERGVLDAADDVRRRWKKNPSSVLSCIKRTREGCDRGSEVGTVHSEQDGERPVPLRKPKESSKRENCEKDFVSKSYNRYALSLLCEGECCSGFGERVCSLLLGKSRVTEDPLEPQSYAEGKGVEEVQKYLRKTLVGKRRAVEKRARAD